MTKLGDFINSLAVKSGIPIDNVKLKALLSEPIASTFEIDQSIIDSINNGLMTEDAAINNPTILNKARAQAYNKVDEALSEKILGQFEDAERDEILKQKYTVDRITEIGKLIIKTKEAKKSAPGVDKEVYQKQIDELQGLLKTEKESHANSLNRFKSEYENSAIDNNLKFVLYGRNYVLPTATESDKQFAVETAALKVKNLLSEKKFKLVNQNGQLELQTLDNLKPYEQGNLVLAHNFIDGAIASIIAPVKKDGNVSTPPNGSTGGHVPHSKGIENAKAAFESLEASFTQG